MMPTITRSALALACSAACLCGVAAGDAAAASGHVPGHEVARQWREYARARITPKFSWADQQPARAPDVLSPYRGSYGQTRLRVALSSSFDALAAPAALTLEERADVFVPTRSSPLPLFAADREAIGNQFVSSSVARRVGESGEVSVGAILARQRFASAGMGLSVWNAPEQLDLGPTAVPTETSTGGGVRVGYRNALADGVRLNVALQSEVDMEPFKLYRGVYSDPGDFDIPGLAAASLHVDLTPTLTLGAGVERVFYSDVDAFTTAALPTRFLALLGDGTSPVFAWQDLTVYSVEGVYHDRDGGQWSLRWSSRQQPSPTSALLELALEEEFTHVNLIAGYRRGFGRLGSLWLAASYSPSEYFLGASPYRQTDLEGSQVEVEALWSVPF